MQAADADPGRGFERVAVGPFRALVGSRNVRNRWLARWVGGRLAGRRTSRTGAFAGALAENVLTTRALRDLPDALQVVFTTTDLGSGAPFRFAAAFVGGAPHGYAEPPRSLPLAAAVAASAAEPSYFAPLHVRAAELGLGDEEGVLSLVDGGVFDNLGTEWFEDWDIEPRPEGARRPEFHVVVDGAGPFRAARRPVGAAEAYFRAPAISDSHMRSERVVATRGAFDRGDLDGVLVSLREPTTDGGAPAPLDDEEVWTLLARLRTDLDLFTRTESTLLLHAGYWSLHARLRARRPELALERPSWKLDLPVDPRPELARGSRRSLSRRA